VNSVVLPSPRSFRATLRRMWGVVLATAVAGIVVALIAGQRTPTSKGSEQTEASVTLAVADGADLAGSSIAPRIELPPVSLDLVWLLSEDFQEQLRERVDENATVTVSSDGVLGIVIFKTTQSTASDSRSVLDAAISIYAEYRARAAEGRLSTRIAALDEHIQELETTPFIGGDAQAASATLADARAERRELEGQRSGLDAVVQEVARTSEAETATERRQSYLLLGAAGGILLGVGIVVVATIFDRRLRTRNDIEAIAGEHSWLGTTPTGADSDSVAIAAALSFGAGTTGRLRLLSIDDNVSVADVVASIRPALDRLVAVGRPDIDLVDGGRLDRASEIFAVDDGTPNVLVIAFGRTDESTLVAGVDQLQRFRLPFVGVIASTLEMTGPSPSRATG
jgi:hypothetical protein